MKLSKVEHVSAHRVIGRWSRGLALLSAASVTLGAGACGVGAPEGAPARQDSEAVGEAASNLSSGCLDLRRGTAGNVADVGMANVAGSTNSGSSGSLPVGLVAGNERQTLMEFDLSLIPQAPHTSVTVTSANLSLAKTPGVSSAGTAPIHIHRVTAPWSESVVTWQSFGGAYQATPESGADINPVPSFPSSGSLQPLVQAWINGTFANNGILLEQGLSGDHTAIASSEYPTVSYRPDLHVCWTATCAAGFADCNNVAADGCEVSLASDVANCGACGQACPAGDTCQAGACVSNRCAGVICAPVDACHAAGVCNPATGACSAGAALGDTTTNLAHHWTFDEPSGTTAFDSAGGNNGTLGSSVSRATSFDGSGAVLLDPVVDCDFNAAVDFGAAPGTFGTGDFTMSFWVATAFSGDASGVGAGDLLGNRGNPTGSNFVSGRVYGNGSCSLELDEDGSNSNHYSTSAPTVLNDSKWHHVVYTRTATMIAMYVDGALVGSASASPPTNITGDSPLRLGLSLPVCTPYGFYSFPALYDDVRTYGRALSQCDVAALATTGVGTPASLPADPCIPEPCPSGMVCTVVGSGYTCQ